MNRKVTPDVLGALMGEATKQESNTAVMEESNKAVNQESVKAIKQVNKEAIKQGSHKEIKKAGNKAIAKQLMIDGTEEPVAIVEEEVKEKATFNLPVKLLSELEDKCYEIRKLCGSKQISKTLIVEEAMRMAFADFDIKKQLSKFYGKLVSNKAIKE